MERWWDGSAWTEYTRTAPVPPAPGQSPGYPGGYPGYPSGDMIASPGGGGRKTGTVVVAIVAALVLIGAVVAGILVLGKGDGGGNDATSTATPQPSATGHHDRRTPGPVTPTDPSGGDSGGSDGGSDGGNGDGTTAVDAADGVSLPVLDGWQGTSGQSGIGASVTIGAYQCPLDTSQNCVRGGAFAEPAEMLKVTATDPEDAAKADIAPNAASSYGPDVYGATTSHRQVASRAITVAGQKGYLVRWKITTKSGTSAYVESLAFASPSRSGKLVMVRFGFDIGADAPGPEVMDQIARGIAVDTSGGTSGTGV